MTLPMAIHKNILIHILKDIYTDLHIAPYLGFKGGTAAMLFYGLTRFSVDLDFDLLDETKAESVAEGIETILKKYGRIKIADQKRFSFIFILVYTQKTEVSQNVKIEINKRCFGSRYEVMQFLGIPMLVMVKEDMFANKLVAMHERIGKTNRDIFDVWFFLHNQWVINKEIIQLRTNMDYQSFLQVCITDLEKTSNRNILDGIGELLDPKQKAWAKATLLSETIFLLKLAQKNQS